MQWVDSIRTWGRNATMLVGVLYFIGTLAGCGDKASAQVCTAGIQIECPCPGGIDSVQACNADGTGYEACQCEAVGSSSSGMSSSSSGMSSSSSGMSSSSSGMGGSGGSGGGGSGGMGGAGGGMGGAGGGGSGPCAEVCSDLLIDVTLELCMDASAMTQMLYQELTNCTCGATGACSADCNPTTYCGGTDHIGTTTYSNCQKCLQDPTPAGCGAQINACAGDA